MSATNFFHMFVIGVSVVACIFVVISTLRALAQRVVPGLSINAEDMVWFLMIFVVIVLVCIVVLTPIGLVIQKFFPDAAKTILNFWGLR